MQGITCHLGVETTRGWSRRTVLRVAPALFFMYTVGVLWHDTRKQLSPLVSEMAGKRHCHVQRRDYQCSSPLVVSMGFRTDARRRVCSETIGTRPKAARLRAHASSMKRKSRGVGLSSRDSFQYSIQHFARTDAQLINLGADVGNILLADLAGNESRTTFDKT